MSDPDNEKYDAPRSPYFAMREMHPDLFSDSDSQLRPIVPRDVLSYHLETLTSQKKELEFEYFARRLAEAEICPNLRPQTGPTGGGDSKVDTETYPVAPEISDRWFIGEPAAGTERWAFAISAKKDWKAKAKSDVKSIVSTKRPYNQIFFITNQYAPDKARAASEDELSELAGTRITILDRTWILEKVYDNDHVQLAVQALGMTGFAEMLDKTLGPNDAARTAELAELDKQMADTSRYLGSRYALAEDALEGALLARALERPQHEVEARFAYAAKVADEVGQEKQRLRIAYNRAWTAYFWHEDNQHFLKMLEVVEVLSLASEDAADLEFFQNLWTLLLGATQAGRLSRTTVRLDERKSALHSALSRAAANGARPNNAAEARTKILLLDAASAFEARNTSALAKVWIDFRALLATVDGLGQYPVERVYNLIVQMGKFIPESEEFDALFDDVVALLDRYRSEGEGGKAYVTRGLQKLKKDRPYEAIRLLGWAEARLVKAEYKEDLYRALAGIGQAYHRVGLLWAARTKLLVICERMLSTYLQEGRLDPRAIFLVWRLVRLEAELGRIPHVLAMYELFAVILPHAGLDGERLKEFQTDAENLDRFFGIALLRTSTDQLRRLERLPDELERLGLEMSRVALLWSLGHIQLLKDEGMSDALENDAAVSDFFESWYNHPLAEKLPARPITVDEAGASLRSVVLGTEICINVPANTDSLFLAESVLSAFESFLATSTSLRVSPYRERLDINVHSDPAQVGLELTFEDTDGVTYGVLRHGPDTHYGLDGDLIAFSEWLRDTIITLALKVLMVSDAESWMAQVAGEESGFSRAIVLGNVAVISRNLFGPSPRFTLESWTSPDNKAFSFQRDGEWHPKLGKVEDAKKSEPLRFETGEPPADLFDLEKTPHGDFQVSSLINIEFWDQAKWKATMFIAVDGGPTNSAPAPIFGLGFGNIQAGRKIFREWRARMGEIDEKDELRIAIIKGIDRKNPHAYAITISSNIVGELREQKVVSIPMRINHFVSPDSANLQQFLKSYAAHGRCFLAPMAFGQGVDIRNLQDVAIGKASIIVREAWQIGRHDPDFMALDPDLDPIVPPDVTDPPVKEALVWHRSRSKPD